jgi:hypothetical protein
MVIGRRSAIRMTRTPVQRVALELPQLMAGCYATPRQLSVGATPAGEPPFRLLRNLARAQHFPSSPRVACSNPRINGDGHEQPPDNVVAAAGLPP